MKFSVKYSNILKAGLSGLFGASVLLLASCTDRIDSPQEDSGPDGEMVKVRFMIPHNGAMFYNGVTRDGDNSYINNGEGVLSNLYVVAIQTTYVDEQTGVNYYMSPDRVVVTPLNIYDDSGSIGEYDPYELSLYPGEYRFYVFANTDLYVDGFYTSTGEFTENDIKKFMISFDSDTPLKKYHLPMACLPEEMQYGFSEEDKKKVKTYEQKVTEGELTDGNRTDEQKTHFDHTITIAKNNTYTVFADLKFMCAKVRYTILFDATQSGEGEEGISSGFGNQSIRFYVDESSTYRPTANLLRQRTYLLPKFSYNLDSSLRTQDEEDPFIHQTAYISQFDDGDPEDGSGLVVTGEYGTWTLPFNRYNWPASGKDYPKSPSDPIELWDASEGLDTWKAKKKRAWQGVIYLPENNYDDEDRGKDIDHTFLRFPYVLDTYANESNFYEYEDGTPSEDDYKEIYLFGQNSHESHYPGGEGHDDPYSDTANDESTYQHGLRRGYFYDVVARVINPDKWDLKLIVYGKIEDWHDLQQEITEKW